MKNNFLNLKWVLINSALVSFFFNSAVVADPKPGPTPDNSAVVAAINNLAKRMEALTNAKVKAANNAAYQKNPNLPTVTQLNNQNVQIQQQSLQQSSDTTAKNIQDSLQQVPDITLTYNAITPDVQQVLDRIKNRNDHMDDLTINLPASDTLYSDVLNIDGSAFFNGGYALSKPTTLHDNYFDFSTVITPKAYNADQISAVQNYVEFVTQRYKPLSGNIDFTTLKSNLDQLKSNPSQLAQALHSFMSNQTYKNYQLSVRSALANQSIALNNFAQFIAERTPLTSAKPDDTLAAISNSVGVKPYTLSIDDPKNPGQKVNVNAYASPMQIADFIANHRTSNPQWYQQMSAASPAAVQRETLFVLAEIESQMYQAHLDNEKILATLTAMQLQSGAANQMIMQTQANELNQVIKNIGQDNASINNQNNKNNYTSPQNINVNPNNASGANSPPQFNPPTQPTNR